MKKVSIIDMGSNSIKILIAVLSQNIYYDVIYEEKIPFRISQHLTDKKELDKQGLKELFEILNYFKQVSGQYQVDQVLGIATEATRRLHNSRELLSQIKEKLDIQIKLLSGEEEAYYGYLAARYTIDLSDYLLIDIGGSSMEIVLVKNKKLIRSTSLPLGAIVTSAKFELGNKVSERQINEFQQFILNEFNQLSWLKEALHLPIIGIGGTIRMISKIYRLMVEDTFKAQHQYSLSNESLKKVSDRLLPLSLKERMNIKGMTKERADIVIGCLLTVVHLMDYIDSKELIINRYGIRQGVVFEQLNIPEQPILDYSLANILFHFKFPTEANDLLKQSSLTFAKKLNITQSSHLNILKTVTKLYKLGIFISYQNVNKHTQYLLQNIQINGLSPQEQLMAIYTLKYLDRPNVKIDNETIITKHDLKLCHQLALITQLASYLTTLKDYFQKIEFNEDEIKINFQNKLPRSYNQKLESLSTQFDETFQKKLVW